MTDLFKLDMGLLIHTCGMGIENSIEKGIMECSTDCDGHIVCRCRNCGKEYSFREIVEYFIDNEE